MKQILEENNLTVMATVARYVCSYGKSQANSSDL